METQLSEENKEQNQNCDHHRHRDENAGPAMIIVYAAIAFSGAIVGFMLGYILG